ncbi:hypothetical protein LQZ19_16250 [Treponema primitia]|uniref:hypothetical protein n=1 Tax=Treponema primitia TaxID=88058 RepID=UPI00397F7EF1
MKRRKLFWILFASILYGGFAIYSFYNLYELIILKNSHILALGSIERIEHKSTGKSSTDWLVFSYTYNGQNYNEKIYISDGIPFLTNIYKDYPKGNTVFMVNTERNIIFPQNNINVEIKRRIFPLILLSIALIISVIIFVRE